MVPPPDEAAEITHADILDAQQQWRRDAPAKFRSVLDAPPRPQED